MLFTLLLLLVALPVAASPGCHDGMTAQTISAHRDHAPPVAAHPAHDCIGCIPPSTWNAARLVERFVPRDPIHPAPLATLDLGRAIPPALPPPRIA